MAAQLPRKRALRQYTWVIGVASMIAGGAVYFQVAGIGAAIAGFVSSVAPSDPGFNGDDGGPVQPAPQQPQYGNPGSQQQPIAVTGGS